MFGKEPKIMLGPDHSIAYPTGSKREVDQIVSKITVLNSSIPSDEKHILERLFLTNRISGSDDLTYNAIKSLGWDTIKKLYFAIFEQEVYSDKVEKCLKLHKMNPAGHITKAIYCFVDTAYVVGVGFIGVGFLQDLSRDHKRSFQCLEVLGKLDELIDTYEAAIMLDY